MDHNLRKNPKKVVIEDLSSSSEDEIKISRAKNWDWDSSYELLRVIHKEGKNWSKVLNILHEHHLVADVDDPAKLRTRYNTLNGKQSILRRDFQAQKFVPAKNMAPDQIRVAEQEHATRSERLRQEHEHARVLLIEIEARESLPSTSEKKTEDEVGKELQAKGAERRAIRNERFQQFMKDGQEEKQYRSDVLGSMKEIFALIRESMVQERELLPNKRQKVSHNNTNQ